MLFFNPVVRVCATYCNRRNFRTRFNFVYFVLLAESTKFSSILKQRTHTSVCDTALAVRKLIAYESSRTLEYEIFTRTKISAITVCATLRYFTWAAARSQQLLFVVLAAGLWCLTAGCHVKSPLFPQPLSNHRSVLHDHDGRKHT